MEEKLKLYLQVQQKFSSIESERIIYGLKAILSEMSKLLIGVLISFPLGYADEIIVATVVLLSIRSNCGGLHFSHYVSCFFFTAFFYMSMIFLASYPLNNSYLALGLVLSIGIFSLIGPITSIMRPRLDMSDVSRYSNRVISLLLIYSIPLILFETLPYRNLIYWVIVLQIFQLLCAKVARKGETYENHKKDIQT